MMNEQTLIANEVEGIVPFTQDVRKGQEQQQQSTTKKTKTKLPQFFSDFWSTGIVSSKLHFPMLFVCQQLCLKLSVLNQRTNWIFILKLSSKESQLKPTVTGQSQEGIMCSDTGLSKHTCSVTKPFRLRFKTHSNCLLFIWLHWFIQLKTNISSNMFPVTKSKTRLNFILWLTDRQTTQDRAVFPLPLIDGLWPLNKR